MCFRQKTKVKLYILSMFKAQMAKKDVRIKNTKKKKKPFRIRLHFMKHNAVIEV